MSGRPPRGTGYFDRARVFIRDVRGDFTPALLAGECSLSRLQAKTALWHLERRGEIERVQHGVYRAPQAA